MADDAASLAQAVRAAPGDGRHVVCLRTSQTRYASYAASAPSVPVGQLVASPKCACTQWLIGDLYASSLHLCSAVPEAASIVRVADYAQWRCAATACGRMAALTAGSLCSTWLQGGQVSLDVAQDRAVTIDCNWQAFSFDLLKGRIAIGSGGELELRNCRVQNFEFLDNAAPGSLGATQRLSSSFVGLSGCAVRHCAPGPAAAAGGRYGC